MEHNSLAKSISQSFGLPKAKTDPRTPGSQENLEARKRKLEVGRQKPKPPSKKLKLGETKRAAKALAAAKIQKVLKDRLGNERISNFAQIPPKRASELGVKVTEEDKEDGKEDRKEVGQEAESEDDDVIEVAVENEVIDLVSDDEEDQEEAVERRDSRDFYKVLRDRLESTEDDSEDDDECESDPGQRLNMEMDSDLDDSDEASYDEEDDSD